MFEELSKLHEWVTGEYFKAIRSYRQERRYKYKVNGKKALVENKILFKSCSDFHLQITTKQGIINYYPSTGEGK
ncbi:hypothetical protein INT80_09415 [Gallibacterium anatis]|uniref:Uncharacterized protein n=1 Tax=Gallibacterium anatis TaxID=750 RepID=A0A930UV24_9PAST|nr:hypothetical protein [Gallibacterium anatis]